ncbi:TolC family protein [Thalassotalea sp. SU-HH00458]|uniref:TolC family protein n=1 Tax=Thalassotalea sp. SU-HH00458 TaxID=3127657 RepID=UPI0033653977
MLTIKYFRCLLLFITFTFYGCSQNSKSIIDNIAVPNTFISKGTAAHKDKWWHAFNNKELNRLVTQALNENNTIQAIQLREKASQLGIVSAGAGQLPSLNLVSGTQADITDIAQIDSANLGLAASWELDLWGKLESVEEKAYWQHQELTALSHAKENLVAASIVNAWLLSLSEHQKYQVLEKQYQRTNQALKVISRRFAMGKSSVTDIWQQEKLVKSIEVKQSKNDVASYLAKQNLANWLGEMDTSKVIVAFTAVPHLPPLPKMGIPLEQLANRPDIQQSFAKVHSADASVATAVAERLPRITLRASYSTQKTNVEELFDDWSGNLISSLVLPLFDGGKRRAVVEQKKLHLQAAIVEYKQTWLEAIAAVNKALLNENQLMNVVENLKLQLSLAQKTEQLTTLKYLNSKIKYISLLNAQEDILSLEIQLIDAKKALLINRVLLYRELSHGDFSQLASTSPTMKE